MGKDNAIALLIAFGNMLIIAIGVAQIMLMSTMWFMPAIIAVLVLHVIATKFSCRCFWSKYGISAGRYILYGALPAALINFVALAVVFVLTGAGFTTLLLPSIDMIPLECPLLFFATGYSTVYIIITPVVLETDKIYKGDV
ncbi:MAG: hypothetical protein HDR72_00930 [Ruminococcaceae bacterium]|nr:hypothetical protein [Oscillospiraceae bacterium]